MANDVSDRDAVALFPAESEAEPAPLAETASAIQRFLSRGRLRIGLALFGLCAFIGVDVFFIVSAMREHAPGALSAKGARAAVSVSKPAPQRPEVLPPASASGVASPEGLSELPLDFDDEGSEAETSQPQHETHKRFRTVREAARYSCSTSSVDGLSQQIVAEARCIDSNAFVRLPTRPNLAAGSQVFPYLEAAARKHLLKVLDAHPHQKMTVHSALRTLAAQYLVWCWGADKRCGVQLAARPGESNHETGLALDIGEFSQWRSALEAEKFEWMGSKDRVHFDYKGSGAAPHRRMDVLAFQQLWNLNHTDDAIVENGKYDSATEQRLKKSPPRGFPIGAKCGAKRPRHARK